MILDSGETTIREVPQEVAGWLIKESSEEDSEEHMHEISSQEPYC